MVREENYLSQVVEYLRKNLKKGYPKESLKWALVNQGHSKLEIDRAFRIVEEEFISKAPKLKTKPQIKYEIVEPKTKTLEFKKKTFWKNLFG